MNDSKSIVDQALRDLRSSMPKAVRDIEGDYAVSTQAIDGVTFMKIAVVPKDDGGRKLSALEFPLSSEQSIGYQVAQASKILHAQFGGRSF